MVPALKIVIAGLALSLSCGPEYLAALHESRAELSRQGRYREALLTALQEAECWTSDQSALPLSSRAPYWWDQG